MTPQKVVVKIPRKQGDLIPFNLELWNTGEYEAVDKDCVLVRILCTNNGGSYPIVTTHEGWRVNTFTIDGRYATPLASQQLFLRKKTSDKLPKDDFINVYPNGIGAYSTLIAANNNSLKSRLAIIHITYEWEDAV